MYTFLWWMKISINIKTKSSIHSWICKTTIYGQEKRSLRKILNVKSARSILLTSVRVKFVNNSNWNLAKDWFWRQNARERPWLLSQREERQRGAKWRMVLFDRGSLSRKLKSENDNCPLIYYLRLCKQLDDKWKSQLIHQEEYLMPHFSSLQSIFLLGWIVRRRRKTSEVLDISRPVVQQLEWEKDEELSARRSHCVIGAELRDGGVPSPEYFSPTTTTTTVTIAVESSRRAEDASSNGVGVPRLASSSCSSSPISPPPGRAVMQQPPQVGTNTLIVRHPALIYCPVVTFIGGAANTSQRTETSLA